MQQSFSRTARTIPRSPVLVNGQPRSVETFVTNFMRSRPAGSKRKVTQGRAKPSQIGMVRETPSPESFKMTLVQPAASSESTAWMAGMPLASLPPKLGWKSISGQRKHSMPTVIKFPSANL